MSGALLRFGVSVKHFSKWCTTIHYSRNFASSSGNLSPDSRAAVATATPQRRIEWKEPISAEKLHKQFDVDIQNGDVVPVFKRALLYGNKIAIKDVNGEYTYQQILEAARKLSVELSALSSEQSTKVAFLCSNSAVYTVVQWACWISGKKKIVLSDCNFC